ncbi:MAG: metallophosphoesterase [bacterium]|nr:metallophosphoesterase [bacterium]
MFKNDEHTILVAGDTHFKLRPDPAEVRRRDLFLSFLEAARDADELVLLGDVFDFWFDYPHFRLRGYDELLTALDGVRDAGVRLHFVGGNHDIWAARLHPELLYAFSHWLSHASRQASRDERHLIEKRARRHLARARGEWDLLLIGHVHHAFRIAEGGREMAALGSWFAGEASYAIVQGGRFELRDFAAEPRPPVADPQ